MSDKPYEIIYTKFDYNAKDLQIDVYMKSCNHMFIGVAQVLDIDTENPLIRMEKPLGFNLVEDIIKGVRGRDYLQEGYHGLR